VSSFVKNKFALFRSLVCIRAKINRICEYIARVDLGRENGLKSVAFVWRGIRQSFFKVSKLLGYSTRLSSRKDKEKENIPLRAQRIVEEISFRAALSEKTVE